MVITAINILWLNIFDLNVGASLGRDLRDSCLCSVCMETGNGYSHSYNNITFTFSELV